MLHEASSDLLQFRQSATRDYGGTFLRDTEAQHCGHSVCSQQVPAEHTSCSGQPYNARSCSTVGWRSFGMLEWRPPSRVPEARVQEQERANRESLPTRWINLTQGIADRGSRVKIVLRTFVSWICKQRKHPTIEVVDRLEPL